MDKLDEIRQRAEQLVRIADNPYCLGPAALLDGVKEIVPALLSEVDRLEKGWQEALALANTNAKLFDEATARAEKAEAERDAATKYIPHICCYCKKDYYSTGKQRCEKQKEDGIHAGAYTCGEFEWRGQAAGKEKNDANG